MVGSLDLSRPSLLGLMNQTPTRATGRQECLRGFVVIFMAVEKNFSSRLTIE